MIYKTLALTEEEFDILNDALIEQSKWESAQKNEYAAEILDRIQERMHEK